MSDQITFMVNFWKNQFSSENALNKYAHVLCFWYFILLYEKIFVLAKNSPKPEKKPSIWIKMCNILIGEWKKLSGILILLYRLPDILVDISYFVCNADIKKGFNYNFTGFKCFLTQNILFMVVTLKTWNW